MYLCSPDLYNVKTCNLKACNLKNRHLKKGNSLGYELLHSTSSRTELDFAHFTACSRRHL